MDKRKKITLILLIILTLIGSLFVLLATNMLMDDLFNKAVGFRSMTIFVTLPAMSIGILFILTILYLIRIYKHPNSIKRITKLYLIIALISSIFGIIGSILGGSIVYDTFVGRNPFPGYLIIFLILNALILVGSINGLFLINKKIKDDKERIKINFLYVIKTIGWVLFIGLTLDKLGLFLSMPIYVYLKNLYITFPTYLYLLLPLFLGVIIVLFDLGILDRKKTFILGIISLGINLILFNYTLIWGLIDTNFISSISQIYPIDRMTAMSIEFIIHFLAFSGVSAAILVISRPKNNKEKL